MSDTNHLCPRRSEGVPADAPEHDTWIKSHCSYCGSLEPSLLLALIEAKQVVIGPTDKNYKIYVTPNAAYTGFIGGKTLEKHNKFYFQHLEPELERKKFFDLYIENTMELSEPGFFYILPYFMKAVDLTDPNAGDTPTVSND